MIDVRYASRSRSGRFFLQVALAAFAAFVVYWVASNVVSNLQSRNIELGFDFLWQRAGFDIEPSLISWDASDSNGRALLVGVLNTLLVAILAIVLSTILGFILALMRVSPIFLLRVTALIFIDTFRVIPLLVQIMFWYVAVLRPLPSVAQSITFGPFAILNVQGLYIAWPDIHGAGSTWLVALWMALGCVGAYFIGRRFVNFRHRGRLLISLIFAFVVVVLCSAALSGASMSLNFPTKNRFSYSGGLRLHPEFVALVAALSISGAAFMAEIFRAGFQAVSIGYREASASLGLTKLQTLRLVEVPLALRVIIPPMANQYVGLTKATSLAVAVGYPDIMQIFAGTVLSITGRAIQIMALCMGIYLTVSLITAGLLNLFNYKYKIIQRS